MSLSEKALLVQLRISQWSARKYDKKISQQIADINGINISAGRFNKVLLPMTGLLTDVYSATTRVRKLYYDSTLPWGMEGTHILPSKLYMEFINEFRNEKAHWQKQVNKFIAAYPSLKHDAFEMLGPMYNEADYPDPSKIASRFSMDLAVLPVPENDFRVALNDEEKTRIEAEMQERLIASEEIARQEIWKRLYTRVSHVSERLSDPEAVFRNSTISNVAELCDLVPKLNINDDPDIAEAAIHIKGTLVHDPDVLRNDPDLRKKTATQANRIMDIMGTFMGET